jgi:sorbitol/mannitol transport system permease protein
VTVAFFPNSKRSYLQTRGRFLISPAVAMLLVFSLLPLIATIRFSLIDYRLLMPERTGFVGLANYHHLVASPDFVPALFNTIFLVGFVVSLTVAVGLGLAILLDRARTGRSALRLLVISPFFVMPPVSALIWKNLLMQPVAGFFAWMTSIAGLHAFDWFARAPLVSISLIVAWQWLPFAALILLTSLQSFDQQQREAAEIDGASALAIFRNLQIPHLARPIAIVVMIETIFLLSVFAEILVTTGGGTASTNLAFLVYGQAMLQYDVGAASAAGVIAILFANVVAFFLLRVIGRSLEV